MNMNVPSVLALCFMLSASFSRSQEEAPFPPPPESVSSVATLVSQSEPGERLIIRGKLYARDGQTPLPGFVLYLYQTDSSGVYNNTDGKWWHPRIRGWLRTAADGSYEIRTIKPGSYPGSRNPAHIHVIAKVGNNKPDWLDDFLFEGDPFLSESDRGRIATDGNFSPVMKIKRESDGTLHCSRDIRIPTVGIDR
jgi:protocatechuate 3,4-dioxygenase beta subunit